MNLQVFCTFLLFIVSFSYAHSQNDKILKNLVDGPIPYGDSGVKYPKYTEVENGMAKLALKYPSHVKHVQYGKSIKGVNLNLLRIEKRDRIATFVNAPAVEISGTIHGNEYLGIEDKFAAYFLDNQDMLPGFSSFLDKGGVVYIVPIVNPDGFIARTRGNDNGADLNRDFDVIPTQTIKFKEKESKALAQYLDQDLTSNSLSLKLSMDYHCCVPALITPWTYANKHVPAEDAAKFSQAGDIQMKHLGYDVGNAIDTVGYLAIGTTVDYFYAKYGAVGLTLEGKHGGEESAFMKHIHMWDAIFMALARN